MVPRRMRLPSTLLGRGRRLGRGCHGRGRRPRPKLQCRALFFTLIGRNEGIALESCIRTLLLLLLLGLWQVGCGAAESPSGGRDAGVEGAQVGATLCEAITCPPDSACLDGACVIDDPCARVACEGS